MPVTSRILHSIRRRLALCLVCVLAPYGPSGKAAELQAFLSEARGWVSEAQVLWENDSFAGSDRYT